MTIGFDGFELPPPTDWQKFERLCCDLWAAIWKDPNTQLNGRSGQEQAGVDVFGRRAGDSGYSGVQCKRRGTLADGGEISEKELRAEVIKARSFEPPLQGEFVLAYTGKRDARIQAVARAITAEHLRDGLFEVTVCSWEDVQDRLGAYPDVFSRHFAGLVASIGSVHARAGMPTPVYLDAESRVLSQQLRDAKLRQERLHDKAASTIQVDREIRDIKRRMREGGHLKPGDCLGKYLLLNELGHGGFATVWQAWDEVACQHVAVKVLHGNVAGSSLARERFGRGAHVMKRFDHPNITRVLELDGEDGNWHYFVMELLSGHDLRSAVKEGRIARGEIISLMISVSEAVAVVHDSRIVHRDLKPANVLLDELNHPKITDFDLVYLRDTWGGTHTGGLGTPIYSAPEAFEPSMEAIPTADVWSLAMITIFCFHGRDLSPLVWGNTGALIGRLSCGARTRDVLARATAENEGERFPNARAFRDALAAAQIEVVNPHTDDIFGATGEPVADAPVRTGTGLSAVEATGEDALLTSRSRDSVHSDVVRALSEFRRVVEIGLGELRRTVRFDSASVQLVNGDSRTILVAWGFDQVVIDNRLLRPISLDPLVSRIFASRQVCLLSDVFCDPDWGHVGGAVRAWIGAPIFHGEEAVGFLTLDFEDRTHIEEYRPQIDDFVRQVGPVLEDALPLLASVQAEEARSMF